MKKYSKKKTETSNDTQTSGERDFNDKFRETEKIKQIHFSDRIRISLSLEPDGCSITPPEIEVAEECFLIARAIFQVLAMTSEFADGEGIDNRIHPFEAVREVSILGIIFSDLAFNSLDEYGIRIFQESKNGGAVNA